MSGALSPTHWLIIIGVLVVLLGSKKLPDAARGIGQSLRIFKTEIAAARDDQPAADNSAPAAAPPMPITASNGGPAAQPRPPAEAGAADLDRSRVPSRDVTGTPPTGTG